MALGAILAGGASRRMGTDKALVEVAGLSMIERVAAALGTVADDLVVVGRTGALAGIPCIPDLRTGPRGPLPGVAAALAHAGADPVLAVAVDQPLVRPETLQRLLDLAEPDRAVVPIDAGARQVTCAVYPAAWAAETAAEDAAGGSVQSLLDRLPFRPVMAPEWRAWGEDGSSWLSVDSPDDVADAAGRLAG